ncbi:MAG: DUF2807 domain-containing protein [Rikenellaceae bacterium]|nr:DUF2807 domain-containing protein [Rikenellaceae bacterium]
MKKPVLALAMVAAMLFTVSSLCAQTVETRTFTLNGSYDAIDMAGTQTLHFDIGPAGEPLTVIGSAEDLDNLEISVRNHTLTINFRRGYRSRSRTPVEIYAKNPSLRKAGVSGTGTVNITGRLDGGENEFTVSGTGRVNVATVDCEELSCRVSGTGKVNCASVRAQTVRGSVSGTGSVTLTDVVADHVEARSSGTGNVNLSGTTRTCNYRTSGTGHIHAEDLAAGEVSATASGTGSIYCKATAEFEGQSSGTGKINLYGNPETVNYSGSERRLVRR